MEKRIEFICQCCGDIVNIEDESEVADVCKKCEEEWKK